MGWRRINFILHRDFGYLCIGLTVIYAISGIAVNHTSHNFNPSYTIEKTTVTVSPVKKGMSPDREYVEQLLDQLETGERLKSVAMLSPGKMRIFTEESTIDVEIHTGRTMIERVNKIPLLFEWNYLHLNKAKGAWTWFADIYGAALILLALTGMLMIRGRNLRRGLLFTGAGILLPIGYLYFTL